MSAGKRRSHVGAVRLVAGGGFLWHVAVDDPTSGRRVHVVSERQNPGEGLAAFEALRQLRAIGGDLL